ncbi:uncharacterized protein LAESUDRAFT_765394 [Laetiporus sulphureus 93-53]|uniref:Trafficking protein particle complex subunit 11 domain-containing protein n=1 Tax=Laetiporus sulphureus 93-53 TaxID=1314785 RepID=A0A165ASD4_9APHY|nr:uncharacterized protein LAESUDRAFT_765394 [Laetiporus sulphureus 93-53]KZS99570.1 hypothetical protein LAESUDRAFT_765394 [Laetiporus sulphureus 93-53]
MTFQVVIVDKDVRFPPHKLVPPDDPQYSSAHSPLPPLIPTSPLYPDGLIAPIWVRKHTTLVPSVFVMFMHIFEPSQNAPHSPLDPGDGDHEIEAEERMRDNELCAEIAQKKSTSERGVKLMVIPYHLISADNPSLDGRLTYIRRQSGLDPRAAPESCIAVRDRRLCTQMRRWICTWHSLLNPFSLQEALYEPALEYYTNHSKRVRRKRNRYSQAATSYVAPSLSGSKSAARPLRPEGWTVRYEYKMACFAEFRGEDEVALKHYQDAYSTLLLIFRSTAILPPRTKRWA